MFRKLLQDKLKTLTDQLISVHMREKLPGFGEFFIYENRDWVGKAGGQ